MSVPSVFQYSDADQTLEFLTLDREVAATCSKPLLSFATLPDVVWPGVFFATILLSKVCRGFGGIVKLGSLVLVSETSQVSAEIELVCGEVAAVCSEPCLPGVFFASI